MKQATYYIEQVYNSDTGITRNLTPQHINKLNEAKRLTEKFLVPTVAFFKVYLKHESKKDRR